MAANPDYEALRERIARALFEKNMAAAKSDTDWNRASINVREAWRSDADVALAGLRLEQRFKLRRRDQILSLAEWRVRREVNKSRVQGHRHCDLESFRSLPLGWTRHNTLRV